MSTEMDNVEQRKNLSDWEIFTKIWFSPRKVFRDINDRSYGKYVPILLVLAGISSAFDQAISKDLGDKMPLLGVLGICIIGGGLLGWIGLAIYAALVSWTGKWLKGKGKERSILRIMAYASIPLAVSLICLIPQIGIHGNEIFESVDEYTAAPGLVLTIVFWLSLLLGVVLGIWALVLSIVGISEVQKFSIGKSILNLLMPVFVIAVPILLLVILL